MRQYGMLSSLLNQHINFDIPFFVPFEEQIKMLHYEFAWPSGEIITF